MSAAPTTSTPTPSPTVTEAEARRVAEAAREKDWHKPSFAKELFLGRFRLDLIHPHPTPTPEATARGEEFLARLRAFCESEVDSARIEREARIPDETVRGLKELGALGMKIDTKYGGLGLTQVYYNKALALAGSASPAIGALLSAHQSIGVPQPLKMFGTEEQKERFLPRCARTDISAFLLTEPDVGSDPARLATRAVPDGEDYVLDGVKLWTTNGVVADLLVVMARVPASEGHKGGITAFVVEADSEGITVENRNAFMGLRGLENGVTRFHRVRVPAAHRIGPEGAGLKIALTTLNTGRLSLPAMCAGAGKWCLKIAREWSSVREQWGRPVAYHEAVGAKISFIAATSFALEAVVDLASQMADEDRNDIRIEAALAKLYGSEMACLMADELVQIRGGRGFETADSLRARGERGVPAEQMLRDLRINRIFEGSTEIMHLLIAREAVDAHLSVAGDLIDPDKSLSDKARAGANAGVFYAKWLPKLVAGPGQLPRSYAEFHPAGHLDLSPHLRYVERGARKLARSTFYAMSRWQGRMETKQGFLGRIVDIGAELFAMSAACVRAERLRAEGEHGREAYQLADAFCRQARLRVEELFGRLWTNTDELDRRVVKQVLSGAYEWLEEGVVDPSGEGPWIADATPGPSNRENVRRPLR
ncbi:MULTISPECIES: acyl-CoA dehydrogenase family protein [Streptomyces]|jgi:alkylation response protein AidB-like acyl-CoA dehydrogenase|uniref:Acyl CoA dehydrogenase n=4 Tax=Streptomyces TaxID=1883 RepID=F3NFG7_9ACTN|nr:MULTISPECIES: acyl-CoA dehydrogenase family protein [Streptomyces]EGG47780.1 acyl CoA dehydrogenase [Streptomyces griseoaurantiacus M045]MBA5223145.1 acyl-CoA dehydrogenase family protein [Streptomyces griseoaurantiacus]MCF0091019.1 putative acyl-CoA dehydrogenase FadE10 [Streptomyces sp. MH192]MCF0103381.1 putative acyl-CoA dehydrogenase FadE10 [Streptomyces sp. MH191]MDX3092545.1 acyl-CoA dehydrogenase family protein [Streptomyces sp. ME12-02E]